MKLLKADLWSFISTADAICITTNGCVKADKTAVMGKGIAAQALARYPGINITLGLSLTQRGNHVCVVVDPGHLAKGTSVVAFPTKPGYEFCETASLLCTHMQHTRLPARVPGWAFKSPPALIERSLVELIELADKRNWLSIVLPLPGVGNGELSEEESIKLVSILDNRFIVLRR